MRQLKNVEIMGIKSFQGKRDKASEKEESEILVSDYMTTKLITFRVKIWIFKLYRAVKIFVK